MAEPDKQQFGDGSDQWANAAQNLTNAAKELGKESAKQAASAGTAAATAHSSAAFVKAGVEGGKAISEIAAGTAAGGPWGAVLSAAWSLRHTLYKLLVCTCLVLLIFIILLTSHQPGVWPQWRGYDLPPYPVPIHDKFVRCGSRGHGSRPPSRLGAGE